MEAVVALSGLELTQWAETYTSNIHSNVFDPYSRDNPNVDEAWKALVDTHITTISEEEKQKLPGGRFTARAYGGEDGYAVLIEVFHQLHCLVSASQNHQYCVGHVTNLFRILSALATTRATIARPTQGLQIQEGTPIIASAILLKP